MKDSWQRSPHGWYEQGSFVIWEDNGEWHLGHGLTPYREGMPVRRLGHYRTLEEAKRGMLTDYGRTKEEQAYGVMRQAICDYFDALKASGQTAEEAKVHLYSCCSRVVQGI